MIVTWIPYKVTSLVNISNLVLHTWANIQPTLSPTYNKLHP